MRSRRKSHGKILLKLSGESLLGDGETFCRRSVRPILDQIAVLRERSVSIGVVIGGGNLYRGRLGQFSRETGDRMGMLATALNGLALREFFEEYQIPCLLQSALPLSPMVDPLDPLRARAALDMGSVVIFCGGTGLPYFSTDTAAALRALDIHAEILLKASSVDGVYAADPRLNPAAQRFEEISYDEALQKQLSIMDPEAFCLCRSHRLPIVVFPMHRPGALVDAVDGKPIGTLVDGG